MLGYKMFTDSITLKANNHRIYQCPENKKLELLKKIINDNTEFDIVIATVEDTTLLKDAIDSEKIKILQDNELVKLKNLECDLMISYDMPIKAIVYMARISKTRKRAVMLLTQNEQKNLHAIETLLGRAIKQESIEGFMYEVEEKVPSTKKKITKEKIKEIAKERHENATVDKPKNTSFENRKKAPNKFLGKDESKKEIFSAKSGDRNHRYDGTSKDKYSTPKKIGKKINIKARNPKNEE